MGTISIKVITQEEVAKIFRGNINFAFDIVSDALLKAKNQDVIFPDKISQIFDEQTQNRINCMPATLISDKVSGLKWVSVFPTNAQKKIQNVTGIMLMSEIETGFPVAIIDGTLCTKLRTAAVGCVAAKYLAPSNVRTLGIIGAGEEAKMHFILLKKMFPTISECRISSRSAVSEQRFIQEMSQVADDVHFVAANNDSHIATDGADIVITAISGQAPVLKASNITKGCLYIHVGGWEDEYDVALKADKIVCDDWEASKHRTQTICRMYKEGILDDSDIYANLVDIISNEKIGRENDDEFIYFNSVGLSYIDLNFANEIYKKALENNLGQNIILAESSEINYKELVGA